MKNFFRRLHNINTVIVIFLLMGYFSASDVYAYTDQITVKAEEAWRAAQEVLKPRGFHKVDEKKLTLETKWTTDRVVRSRGLLKNFASQNYERRYRIIVKVLQRDYDTEISVNGKFQERPSETNQNIVLWKSYHPEGSDYDIERQVFMQILNRLELARSGKSTS